MPRGDADRMAQWLGANVGDHLAAAAANLQASEPRYAEQAIAAEGLSAASVAQVRPLLHAHWQRLTDELVPLLEKLIEQDAAGAAPDNANTYRVRFGIYGFDTAPAPVAAEDAPSRRARKTSDKKGSAS